MHQPHMVAALLEDGGDGGKTFVIVAAADAPLAVAVGVVGIDQQHARRTPAEIFQFHIYFAARDAGVLLFVFISLIEISNLIN